MSLYIITGKTRMSNVFCISAYDVENRRYIRPRPNNQKYFTAEQAGHVSVFSVVKLIPLDWPIQIVPPHCEDVPVDLSYNEKVEVIATLDEKNQITFLKCIADPDVASIFQDDKGLPTALRCEKSRYYVDPGRAKRSLGTVEVNWLKFVVGNYDDLRIYFRDLSGIEYKDVKVVSADLLQRFNHDRRYIERLNQQAQSSKLKFVRLSLSRPFRPKGWSEEKCFLQVSGVHLY